MASRLIVRSSVDYLVRWANFASSYNGGDLVMALVQSTVFQASTDHLDRLLIGNTAPGLDMMDGVRGISIYALASALSQPRETIRRKVKHLEGKGYIVRAADGFRIPDGHLGTNRSSQALLELAAFTQEYLTTLTGLGLVGPGESAIPNRSLALFKLARSTNTFCLRVLEDLSRLSEGDVMRPLIFSAISVANTRHLPLDPEAADADWGVPLPDELRRPVTALALAQHMGLPRETMRRYLAKVELAGGCRRVRGGYIAVEAAFDTPAAREVSERIVAHARRFVAVTPISILKAVMA